MAFGELSASDYVWSKALLKRLKEEGLEEARHLAVLAPEGAASLLESAFPDATVPFTEAFLAATEVFLKGMGRLADWQSRLRSRGCDPRLEDVLDSLEKQKRMRLEESSTSGPLAPGASSTGKRPRVRATWARTTKEERNDLKGADDKELEKWASRAIDLLKGAQTPSWKQARSMEDPDLILKGLLGKSRAATIRLRVRTWEEYMRWLWWRKEKRWPSGIPDVLEYVAEKMEESPAASFPRSFGAALVWFESRGGVPVEEKLSNQDMVRKFLENAATQVTDGSAEIVKAPRFSLAMLVSLETLVADFKMPKALRVLAWARLVKVYGALRADDMQRIRPAAVELNEGGLVATLCRTKTSGPGKALLHLKLFIPVEAYVSNPLWLAAGHALWVEDAHSQKDFFLARARGDLSGFEKKAASKSDMAGMMMRLLLELRVPKKVGEQDVAGGWVNAEEKFFAGPAVLAFTGHSERATLTSLLAALGVPRAEREHVGRWAPRGGDEYVRTYRSLMRSLAKRFRSALGGADLYTLLDEEEVCEGILTKLKSAKMEEDAARGAVQAFRVTVKGVMGNFDIIGEPTEVSIQEPAKEVMKDIAEEDFQQDQEMIEAEAKDKDDFDYIIAAGFRRKVNRLHLRHGCWRTRQMSFASFDLVEGTPSANSYTHVCRDCWPRGDPIFEETGEVAAESSDDESGSDGTEESSTLAKRGVDT